MNIDPDQVAGAAARRMSGRGGTESDADPHGEWRACIRAEVANAIDKDNSAGHLRAAATCLRHILNNPEIPKDENYREQIKFIADQCWECSK